MKTDGILPAIQEDGNTPKTIHSSAATTSGISVPKRRGRGAPPGNLNALKTGRHTAKSRAARKQIWVFTSGVCALVRGVEKLYGFQLAPSQRRKQRWPVLSEEERRKYRERVGK